MENPTLPPPAKLFNLKITQEKADIIRPHWKKITGTPEMISPSEFLWKCIRLAIERVNDDPIKPPAPDGALAEIEKENAEIKQQNITLEKQRDQLTQQITELQMELDEKTITPEDELILRDMNLEEKGLITALADHRGITAKKYLIDNMLIPFFTAATTARPPGKVTVKITPKEMEIFKDTYDGQR